MEFTSIKNSYLSQPFRPGESLGLHFNTDIVAVSQTIFFKYLFLNENVWISLKTSLKFVPKCSIYNIPALVQRMAWRRPGDKPLPETLMVSLLTHICVTRPHWVLTSTILLPPRYAVVSIVRVFETSLPLRPSYFSSGTHPCVFLGN